MLKKLLHKLMHNQTRNRNVGFIIGTGRCGTTMLAQMLNSHSRICVPHELQILFQYSNNGSRLYEIFSENKNINYGPEEFIRLIDVICPYNFLKYFDYASFFQQQKYPIFDLDKLVADLYTAIAISRNKNIFIEQSAWYGQRIDILNELFPSAKYIHMIRDGRDVAISFARTPWWHNDIIQNLERWNAEILTIISSLNAFISTTNVLQIRYEDFLEAPHNNLQRICDLLEVDFEDSMLDPTAYIDYSEYSKSETSHASSTFFNEWSLKKDSPVFSGSRYAWKRYQDFNFKNIPAHISQTLHALGYET
jgi:hypothetical protein